MEKELLEKIRTMLYSEDLEMITLARRLFWMNEPEVEDYNYVGASWKGSEESFGRHKAKILENIELYT